MASIARASDIVISASEADPIFLIGEFAQFADLRLQHGRKHIQDAVRRAVWSFSIRTSRVK